ncbi:helix-turn-helix domain-containing protein [Levilactobacillus wangkuiensis]|uniref:helix-turn-helix domain-containing protein n=1 Tax=Levilactobacillus wangkuiensis TaxID=2799566 RepID=UPI00194DD46F|nr:helix-turn-helix transcriptional regulator [Levilactobacillus wangkuiensis]
MANKDLASRIIDLREKNNLTQTELASRLNVDKSSMSKIEKGTRKVSSDELSQIADIFDVTTDYLLGKNQTPAWATKEDTTDLKEFLESNEGSMTFGGVDLTPEQDAQVRVAMATIFWNQKKKEKK